MRKSWTTRSTSFRCFISVCEYPLGPLCSAPFVQHHGLSVPSPPWNSAFSSSHGPVNLHSAMLIPSASFPLCSIPSGPVRHQGEPSTSLVCLPMSRPGAGGGECPLGPLVPLDLHLPISAFPSGFPDVLPAASVSGSVSASHSLLCSVRLSPQSSA